MSGMGKPGDQQTWVYSTTSDAWFAGASGGGSSSGSIITITTGSPGSVQYHDTTYSPIALWQLSGSLADSSTYVTNLTCSSGNTRYTNMGRGLRGMGFDGLTVLSLTASMPRVLAMAMTGSVTIEMLTIVEPSSNTQVLFFAGGFGLIDADGSENFLYQMAITPAGAIDYFAETNTGVTNVQSTTRNVIPFNELIHLAQSRDNSGIIRTYINGALLETSSATTLINTGTVNPSSARFQIGSSAGASPTGFSVPTSAATNTSIASVKIVDRALTEGEVYAEYQRTLGNLYPTIVVSSSIVSTTVTSSLTRTPIDSYTLHNWIMNDSGSSFTDVGTTPTHLTSITSPVVWNETGIFNDAAYFSPNSAAQGAAAAGNPVSTTQLSMHGWVKIRAFTNSGPRLITKAYNTTFAAPQFISAEIYLAGTTGAVGVQWTSAGSLKTPSAATTRGILLVGQWHHIAVTLNVVGANMIACTYVNGTLVNQTSTASGGIDWNGASSGPWSLGGATGTLATFCLDGWLHDWRVEDGIVRTPDYFKTLYKRAMSLPY